MQAGETNKTLQVYFVDAADAGISIAAATTKQIKVRKKGSATQTLTADFITTGSDGGLEYLVTDENFLTEGEWSIQGIAEGSGFKWKTVVGQFQIDGNL